MLKTNLINFSKFHFHNNINNNFIKNLSKNFTSNTKLSLVSNKIKISTSKNCFYFNTKYTFFDNYKLNAFHGVLLKIPISITPNTFNISDFQNKIKENIKLWEDKQYKSATITIPTESSFLIKYFVDEGFTLHHTNQQDIVICKWLCKTTSNKIPDFCHHYVGVGAIIINKKMQTLLVKENLSEFRTENNSKPWKFVTGHVNPGEDIITATLREINEEVGLTKINVLGNLTVRDVYPSKNGKSDICFFNLCTIDEGDDNIIFKDKELSDAKYFSFDEIASNNLDLTEATTFSIKRLKTLLKDYKEYQEYLNYKNKDKQNIDKFSLLPKICRPMEEINKSKYFSKAFIF